MNKQSTEDLLREYVKTLSCQFKYKDKINILLYDMVKSDNPLKYTNKIDYYIKLYKKYQNKNVELMMEYKNIKTPKKDMHEHM